MEPEKTKEELVAYAIKMRQRGDRYRSILFYLESNCQDPVLVQEIIGIVDELETKKKIDVDHTQGIKPSNYKLMGYIFIGAGIFLFVFLWNRGWISTLPVLLIGMGIYGMSAEKGNKI